jgi:hypothetical protein
MYIVLFIGWKSRSAMYEWCMATGQHHHAKW